MSTTTPTRSTPSVAAIEWLAIGGVAASGLAIALNPATIEDGPILCPFRLITGLPCPGCGLTRSWVYGVHGWWGDAFAANPFGVPLLIAVLITAVVLVVRRVRKQPPPNLDRLAARPAVRVVFAVWLVWGVIRAVSQI